LVIATLAAVPMLITARRRRTWETELAAAELEVRWFARVLLAELCEAGSAEQVRGGWRVGEGRVSEVEDRLTGLEMSGRDDIGRARAKTLRDAVRTARSEIRELAVSGASDVTQELDAVAAELHAALDSDRTTAASREQERGV
jgi:hypothetical protein